MHRTRYLSLWCPSWPVTACWLALGNKPDIPTVIFDRDDNKAHVLATCSNAYSAGIRRGMRKRSAESIVPDALFAVSDSILENKMFTQVLDATRDMVPQVSLVRPGRLECNARGPSRYFGGEEYAARELLRRVKSLGIEDVFIGVANTRFASFVAARVAPYQDQDGIYIVGETLEQTQEFIAPQPLSLLDAPQIVSLLERVGLSTLGDIAQMNSGDMLARFGQEGVRVHSLVTGYEDGRDERELATQSADISREYESDDPLTTSTQAAFVAKNLARELSEELDNNAMMCSEIEVTTHLSSGEICNRSWRVETTALEQVIASRVLLQCQEWLLQKGLEEVSYVDEHILVDSFPRGITRIVVTATHVVPSHRRQVSLFGTDPASDENALRCIDRVKAIIGEQSVVELFLQGGRMPQETVKFQEYCKTLDDFISKDLFNHLDDSDFACTYHWPGAIVGKTPMCNFEQPIKARLLDKNNQPIKVHATGILESELVYIESAAISPGRQEVKDFAGPWPLEDNWWDEKKRRRICRFQVLCSSGAYLIVTKGSESHLVAQY